ncbi:MAG: hypothetical protein ABEL76_14725, partial [Bradymonadaceae bacterium]
FEGVNVHVRNGSGSTSTTNGKGNVVIGYNENNSDKRKGSHNLVVGDRHSYTKASYAGIVAGKNNRIAAKYASVTGGRENRAETPYSAVLGGRQNRVVDEKPNKNGNGKDGAYGVVAAGFNNRAWGDYSSVSGGGCAKQWGRCNAAKEKFSTVVGGTRTEVPPSPRSSWGKKEQHLWGHYGGRQEDFFLIRSGNGEQCYDLDWRHRCKNP